MCNYSKRIEGEIDATQDKSETKRAEVRRTINLPTVGIFLLSPPDHAIPEPDSAAATGCCCSGFCLSLKSKNPEGKEMSPGDAINGRTTKLAPDGIKFQPVHYVLAPKMRSCDLSCLTRDQKLSMGVER